jgi:hypothetical protein
MGAPAKTYAHKNKNCKKKEKPPMLKNTEGFYQKESASSENVTTHQHKGG